MFQSKLKMAISSVLCGSFFLFSPVSNAAQNDGLVAHWSFDDCTAKDVSGNGHDGTINGNPVCVEGKNSKAFSLNGNGDYVEVQSTSELSPSTTMTVSSWVKPSDFYAGECKSNSIVVKGNNFTLPGYFDLGYFDPEINVGGCFANSGKHIFAFRITFLDKTQEYLNGTQDIVLGNWYLTTAVYDGSNVKLYVNGKLEAEKYVGKKTLGDNSQNLTIGRMAVIPGNGDRWAYWVNGGIDETRVYNRALSETEIKALYSNAPGINGNINGVQKFNAVCKNLKTGVSKKIALADGAKPWDCTAAGLKAKKGEQVNVSITGVAK